MNKQSNIYTIIYTIVLVAVVGTALALTAMSMKPKQVENEEADKMRQILASIHITPAEGQVVADFNKYITDQYIINSNGEKQEGKAFDINTGNEVKKDGNSRQLPVFVSNIDGEVKYILPIYGAGLWGPIWGYVSFNADGKSIYGAYFAHQGETPGLGAEIEKTSFSDLFKGKKVFIDGKFAPVEVVKKGQKPTSGAESVDGISGGTITSKGVSAMLGDCLSPYKSFLESLSNK